MRIESIRIDDFGQLHDVALSGLDHPLIVVPGSNEAGKSTFFEFLKTMLFGIYPTSSASHRYAPWSGEVIAGELRLQLSDGAVQTVSRRLRSTPEGQLLNGAAQVLRNQTVPAASHVSRELFDAFYALRLDDLATVHGRSWEEVQQRLLSELSPDSIRPVSKVLRELEESANSLWRPDRRGKPRARQLHEQLRARREEALEARKRDLEARRLAERADGLERRLEELAGRRLQTRTRLKQLEALRPLGELARRQKALQERVGDPRILSDLPADARARLERLGSRSRELGEEIAAVDEQLESLSDLARPPDDVDERLQAHSSEIRRARRQLAEAGQADSELAVEQTRRSLLQQLEAAFGGCPPDADALWSTIEGALAEALHEMEDAADERDRLTARLRPLSLLALPSTVVAGSALLWALLSFVAGGPGWVGWPLAAAAGVLTAIEWFRVRRQAAQAEQLEQLAAGRVASLAREAGLGPGASVARVAESFAALSGARRSLAAAERIRAAGREQRDAEESRVGSWLAGLRLGIGGDPARGTVLQQLGELEERLADAERRRSRADLARPQLERLESTRKRLTEASRQVDDRRRRLEARLKGLDADLETALDLLEDRYQALARLKECDALLGEAPDGAAEEGLAPDPKEVARLEEELETINQQTRRLSAEAATLRTRVEHLREQPSAADLEGEMLALRHEIDDVRTGRDRLALLASIVRQARQRFREKHQPDVLRRASGFLATFTAQRYRRVDFNRESERLEVYNGTADPLPVAEPLSQGTRDQIYLALRLAVVEHLDRRQEALPLFFDEILVNWDRSRRRLGYQVLRDLVARRQLFVFTCHEWLAAELESEAGAHRIELG